MYIYIYIDIDIIFFELPEVDGLALTWRCGSTCSLSESRSRWPGSISIFDTLVLPSDVNVGLETPLMGNLWKIYGKYGKIVYKPYEYYSYISYIYHKP